MHTYTHPFGPHHGGFLAMGHGHGRRDAPRHGGRSWGFPGQRGPRARRGDVRTALLVLLAEEPRNGYQLIQEIEQRSDGAWRPSPGSVYPALQQLEDEGLVTTAQQEGGRVFDLTEAGRAQVAQREDAPAPWEAVKQDAGPGPWQLMQLVREIGMAATQVVQSGDDSQVTKAEALLKETRRSLYRILAEDPPAGDTKG